MAPSGSDDFLALKESGNALFKQGKINEALGLYIQAQLTSPSDQIKEKAAILKNQAACYLKLDQFDKCSLVATAALELTPNDPKALFRRCQALERLGRFDEAFRDARLVAHAEPSNTSVQEILLRLKKTIEELTKKQSSTDQRVTDMLKMLYAETDKDKRRQAANNLIVLARERAGAQLLLARPQALEKMVKILKDSKVDPDIWLTIVRVVGELFKGDPATAREVLRNRIGLPPLLGLYCVANEELVTAVSVAIENLLRTLSGWADKEKPDRKLIAENQDDIDHILSSLTDLLDKAVLSAVGRNSVIDLLLKNIPENLQPGLGWAKQFMELGGVGKLLAPAVVQPNDRETTGSSLNVTNETRIHVSLALQKIYDDLDSDKGRKLFTDKCEEFVQLLLADPDPQTKMRAVLVVITLLQGPFEVGNFLLGSKNILEMLLVMATSDEPDHQIIAAEAIVHAASKKDKCAAILTDGMAILRRLAKSPNDKVQVRALVGLCKAGSSGGIDYTNKPLAESEANSLAESCRKFLTNPAKDFDLRRWAAEGLAYLTLDATVKEALINDRPALRSLIELGKTGNQNIIYGVVSAFVNLTNSYDKPEVIPEMKELAQFAKQHVPTEHPKDTLEFIGKRGDALVEEGVVGALVAVSKVDSKNVRELIGRVMNVVAENKDHRGIMVQQGGAKALLSLALDGTEKGKELASQALARIGITINPEIAFPGQRAYEVVRPLLNLLQEEKSALQNFEALLALTNLAQVSDSVRQRIVKEQGLSKIEHYLYEEHDMLKRAATECICNLMMSRDVQDVYINSEGDRIKLLLLYMADEDAAVARAAAGAVAMLSQDEKACARIIEPAVWLDIIKEISVSEHADIRLRALYIMGNLMEKSEKVATAITQCELLEILMATAQLVGLDNEPAKKAALHALKAAHRRKLIAPNPDYDDDETE